MSNMWKSVFSGSNEDGQLKLEELTPEEKQTYFKQLDHLQKSSTFSVENIRDFVRKLRDSIENELASPGLTDEQNIFLRARLRNILLLDGFITSQEKAKEQLLKQVSKVENSVG